MTCIIGIMDCKLISRRVFNTFRYKLGGRQPLPLDSDRLSAFASWHVVEKTEGDAAGSNTSCATCSPACFSRWRWSWGRKTNEGATNWSRWLLSFENRRFIWRWSAWTGLFASSAQLHKFDQKSTWSHGFAKRQRLDIEGFTFSIPERRDAYKGWKRGKWAGQSSPSLDHIWKAGWTRTIQKYFALDILLTFVDCLPSLHDLKRQLKNIAS